MTRGDQAVGLRLIVLYKAVKAAAEILLATAGAVLLASGQGERLHGFIVAMREHVVAAWSTHLLELLVRETTPGRLWLAVGAVTADGLLTGVEGWALHRRYRWAPWLVVVATSSLVPFEAVELARRMSAVRAATLAVNVLIVAYLVWHAQRVVKGTTTTSGAPPSRSLRADSRSSWRLAERFARK